MTDIQPPASLTTQWRASKALRVSAWISFILNVTIIATGGTVRLTGSGLGCTDWPVCTPGSLVPTPELGIHGMIEFANRTISGPLLLAAVLVLVLSWRVRTQRKDLLAISAVVLLLVLAQAIVGGFVVWQHLDANLVGFHYTVSLVLVCVTAAYLVRMYELPGTRHRMVPKAFAALTHIASLVMGITVFVGVLTTGAGPHSGDERIVREGFDATILAHVHAWPGYLLLVLVLVLCGWSFSAKLRTTTSLLLLLIAITVQILVGVFQARSGLPPVAVGVHMVLASLAAAAMTLVVLRLKQPVTDELPS